MVVTPAEFPVIMPDAELIEATVVELLDHMPPAVASIKVPVDPTHILADPVIGAGDGVTVRTIVT